jgi:hypothetical protein
MLAGVAGFHHSTESSFTKLFGYRGAIGQLLLIGIFR